MQLLFLHFLLFRIIRHRRDAELGFECRRTAKKPSVMKLEHLSWTEQHRHLNSRDLENVYEVVFIFCLLRTMHILIFKSVPLN